jgi:hypothetical protein
VKTERQAPPTFMISSLSFDQTRSRRAGVKEEEKEKERGKIMGVFIHTD